MEWRWLAVNWRWLAMKWRWLATKMALAGSENGVVWRHKWRWLAVKMALAGGPEEGRPPPPDLSGAKGHSGNPGCPLSIGKASGKASWKASGKVSEKASVKPVGRQGKGSAPAPRRRPAGRGRRSSCARMILATHRHPTPF